MSSPHLAANHRLQLVYRDRTPFGSAVSGRVDEALRKELAPIVALEKARGLRAVIAQSKQLLEAASGPLFAGCDPLPETFLYPAAEDVVVEGLFVEGETPAQSGRIDLSPSLAKDLARWLGDWAKGGARPAQAEAGALWDALRVLGAINAEAPLPEAKLADVAMIGHATLCFTHQGTRILVDPFLLPPSSRYPGSYQPLTASELGTPSAVLITHSHPDHFDPSTLLRFGADTPIVVPIVERESVLAVDMGARLEALGFTAVHRLAWGESMVIGAAIVRALPFFGEQPGVEEVLSPEVRNVGNIYLIELGGRKSAVIADSGRDPRGDVKTVAAEARRQHGPIDLLAGGYRGFALYPIHFLFSSVARFLPFVPKDRWGVRQKIMNDADDAIDVAEIWGAPTLLPYADGGAPWYWEAGLGPRLDRPSSTLPTVDPTPEHVATAAAQRSGSPSDGLISSSVKVEILRPGDGLDFGAAGPTIDRPRPWPYVGSDDPDALTRSGDTLAVARKKVLLRLLARKVAAAEALEVEPTEVQAASDEFRRRFGLESKEDMRRFLEAEGVSLDDYSTLIADSVLVERLEQEAADEIDDLLAAQIGVSTARPRAFGQWPR